MFGELKEKIRNGVQPLAKKVPLSPNTLTLTGVLISIVAALQFSAGAMLYGALMILLSGVFDMLDGAVARSRGQCTPFGAVLDSVCDRYADAIIYTGIVYGLISGSIVVPDLLSVPMWLWTVLAMIGSYMVSYTRSRAEAAGVKAMNIGVAERPERMLLLVAGSLTGLLGMAMLLIVLLTHITIVQRLMHAQSSLA